MRGNSFANGPSSVHGNSAYNGSSPNWQRQLYGWVRDPDAWDFMEPGCGA